MRLVTLSLCFAVLAACDAGETPDDGADTTIGPTRDFGVADATSAPDDGRATDATPGIRDAEMADASADVSIADMAMADVGSDAGADLGDLPSCTDAYEPNNVVADATPVMSPATITATNCGFDDDDVYAIDLTAGQTITLTHSFSNGRGNLDMNLHAPSQSGDVSKNGSAVEITFAFEDVETITHTAEETGTYYVLSFNNNDSENSYTLEFDVQ